MKRFRTYLSAGAAATFALLLAVGFTTTFTSCSRQDAAVGELPDGTHPIAFTAAVDGLDIAPSQAATRATTTTAPEGITIAISSNSGTDYKEYTVATGGTNLTPPADPLYWTKTTETLGAWTPATFVTGTPSEAGQYNLATQTTYAGGSFENVLHAAAKAYGFGSTPVALALRHAFAKVSITLKPGDRVTDAEISNATVTLSGYINGTMGYDGTMDSSANSGITPTKNTGVTPNTFTAYLIPQQMQDKPFIRVEIGRNIYYYTPANATDANLEAGKQYTYNVTVKKDKLEVVSTSAAWTDDVTKGDAEIATFQITAPTSVKIAATGGGSLSGNGSGSYTLSGGNAITVTVDASGMDDKFLKGLPAKGVYEITSVSRTDDNYTYTYVLKGDIFFSEAVFQEKTIPAVGDYYYFDNTWSAELWEKPCIGIVFKTGAGDGDNIDNYSSSGLAGTINGYAVALQDAPGGRKPFGSGANISSFTTSTTNFNGYTVCQEMRQQSDFSADTHWACHSALHYTPEAPAASSGWYLPSLGEWNALWQNYGKVQAKFASAGGSDMQKSWGFYWSMSKKSDSDTQPAFVDFGAWSDTNVFSGNIRNDESTSYTRPILTF